MLGRAYLAAEAYVQADAEFDACITRRGEATAVYLDDVPTWRLMAPVYYYRGISRTALKSSTGAAEAFRTFLDSRTAARIRMHSLPTPETACAVADGSSPQPWRWPHSLRRAHHAGPWLPRQSLPLLIWLGEYTRPANTVYPQLPAGSKYGSISGLTPDQQSKQWVAASDDRAQSRLVWVNVTYGPKGLEVLPVRIQELRAGQGVPVNVATEADLEAIVALPNGTFVAAEEGHVRDGSVWPPVLLQIARDGLVTNVIAFPKEFQITGDGKTGLRDNQGFEGLAMTPSGRLIVGLEQPLFEDGAVTFDRGAAGRLIEFEPSGSTFSRTQWRYMISPTPRSSNSTTLCTDGENGLVELLALSETRLISMERSCVTTRDKQFTANSVQLFQWNS